MDIVVVGASNGIDAETTRVLVLHSVHVIMGMRNIVAAKDVKDIIVKDIPSAKLDIMELDLNSLDSVKKFASKLNSTSCCKKRRLITFVI
ncbi:putative very-long-chain 3-oxoacyl-CoA reductase [Medicago truncatula]|uniref:Putative very-long-chain 3-oxoacyl-CoA reductase n=1 Tax=Medicago truncatula TaxID=3880 RepID=A0A072W043_MEDTR|nr:short-chain dehydrogenase, putative [Medicago truncatula]RHN81787.1 putative very-long-chain 3-oxoacyl-CoA reductase [Medicago truncatula]